MTTLQKLLSTWYLFILLAVLTSTSACSKQERNNGEQEPNVAAGESIEPTTGEPEGQWVTTQVQKFDEKGALAGLETRVFGPDGAVRRWVKLEQGRRIKLAAGEWVTIAGTKYTGLPGGRSEIWLESLEIKTQNVDIGTSER